MDIGNNTLELFSVTPISAERLKKNRYHQEQRILITMIDCALISQSFLFLPLLLQDVSGQQYPEQGGPRKLNTILSAKVQSNPISPYLQLVA